MRVVGRYERALSEAQRKIYLRPQRRFCFFEVAVILFEDVLFSCNFWGKLRCILYFDRSNNPYAPTRKHASSTITMRMLNQKFVNIPSRPRPS